MIQPISSQKSSFHKKSEDEFRAQLYIYRGMKVLGDCLSKLHPITPNATLLAHLSTLLSKLDLKIDLT